MSNSRQIFLPESLYDVDSKMNFSKLSEIYENSDSITGNVIRLDSRNHSLIVDLGGGIIGTMPYSDTTIYPIYKNNGFLSPYIYTLVGKNIRAKINSLGNDTVYLSRKANMLEALEYLKEQKEISLATITDFSKMSAFIDIGAGITGRSYGKSFSTTVYHNIKDIGFQKNDVISVSVIKYDPDTKMFDLSRVDTIPPINDIYVKNDIVTCKVFRPVKDGVGYFVCVDKKFSGIVDSHEELKYGDTISAVINKITEKGLLRLDLVEKI